MDRNLCFVSFRCVWRGLAMCSKVRGCYFSSNKCEIGFLTRNDEMA